jgi:hypothetical protein
MSIFLLGQQKLQKEQSHASHEMIVTVAELLLLYWV